jgi:hypothetical protein
MKPYQKEALAPRYRVTTERRWRDPEGAEHWHRFVVIVRRFEGVRPKGRVYENVDIWEHDTLISETGRPPYVWAENIESLRHLVGPGTVPADWEAVE